MIGCERKRLPGPVIKPTKTRVRPSSASANVLSHPSFSTGLYDKKWATVETGLTEKDQLTKRPMTHVGSRRSMLKELSPKDEESKRQRRPTLEIMENIGTSKKYTQYEKPFMNLGSILKGKIEEKIDLQVLEHLKEAFEIADYDRSGKLNLDEFKVLLKENLGIAISKERQIDALFQKIDWSSDGAITWDEFCTYMQLEYEEKEVSYLKAREVAFALPARVEITPHRENVTRIMSTADGSFIAGSTDGTLSFWSSALELKKNRSVITLEQTQRTKPKWITDFLVMNEFNKIIVATGDREIEFFELSSFEPYCRINGLETVPLRLDYSVNKDNTDECMLFWGDRVGAVNILLMHATGECLRTWKKCPRSEGIACVGMETVLINPTIEFIRWKVHSDWIIEIKYYESLRQVISCSNHDGTALVIGCTKGSTHVESQLKETKDTNSSAEAQGQSRINKIVQLATLAQPKPRLPTDQTVFRVYKGVRTFDFSRSKNILVTGGMDRIIRLWNPYVNTRPTGMLRGHNSRIIHLYVAEEDSWLFSISADKCVKVWDINDQNCLLTVRPKGHNIKGDLQACHYSQASKSLMVATDRISMLNVRTKPVLHTDIILTHKEPVYCCRFNSAFNQIITCSDNSSVRIWDIESGNLIFEYGEAHGEAAITCIAFDTCGRRLITGSRDGTLKIWNYNNGHCLREMRKEEDDITISEVTSVQYVEMSRNRFIVAVGWDRRVNLFLDSIDDSVHHTVYPQPKWPDDLLNGHKEDILSLASCPPNLLATTDYDGLVIVWNMVSGHVFCKLQAPLDRNYEDEALDGDLSVNKVIFLPSRTANKDSATLVTSGPRGLVHFWTIYQGGKLFSRFQGSQEKGHMLSTMVAGGESDKPDSHLFVGDKFGFVSVWNISNYCLHGPEKECPELLSRWRSHTKMVTSMDVINVAQIVITSSTDCTVRLWTWEGHYVGTLGQPDAWDLWDPSTFQHPMVPYDVLIDPKSLPNHPVLADVESVEERKERKKKMKKQKKLERKVEIEEPKKDDEPKKDEEDKDKDKAAPALFTQRSTFYVDDETIDRQIKEKVYRTGTGKRLRHERMKPIKQDRGGPSEYQMLPYYDLDDTPPIDEPNVLKNKKTDPFSFID